MEKTAGRNLTITNHYYSWILKSSHQCLSGVRTVKGPVQNCSHSDQVFVIYYGKIRNFKVENVWKKSSTWFSLWHVRRRFVVIKTVYQNTPVEYYIPTTWRCIQSEEGIVSVRRCAAGDTRFCELKLA